MIYLKKTVNLNEYHFNNKLFIEEPSEHSKIVKKQIKETLDWKLHFCSNYTSSRSLPLQITTALSFLHLHNDILY